MNTILQNRKTYSYIDKDGTESNQALKSVCIVISQYCSDNEYNDNEYNNNECTNKYNTARPKK